MQPQVRKGWRGVGGLELGIAIEAASADAVSGQYAPVDAQRQTAGPGIATAGLPLAGSRAYHRSA